MVSESKVSFLSRSLGRGHPIGRPSTTWNSHSGKEIVMVAPLGSECSGGGVRLFVVCGQFAGDSEVPACSDLERVNPRPEKKSKLKET